MAQDSFPPRHPASEFEGSAAIAPVTSDVMAHAGKQAAELVEDMIHKPQPKMPRAVREKRKAAPGAEATATDVATPQAFLANSVPAEAASEDRAPVQEGAEQPARLEAAPLNSRRFETEIPATDGVTKHDPLLAQFTAATAETLRTNIDAAFEFWTSMMGVRSFSDACDTNARLLCRQMQTLAAQSEEASALATQFAFRSLNFLTASSNGR